MKLQQWRPHPYLPGYILTEEVKCLKFVKEKTLLESSSIFQYGVRITLLQIHQKKLTKFN